MMNIKNEYESFNLINKLYFVRTGGSEEENKAADIIIDECKKLGIEANKEEFLVDGYKINEAYLAFKNPNIELECVGVGMSSSTPDGGISGEFCYVNSLDDAYCQDLKGKICLVHAKLVPYKLYKYLASQKVRGLILCTGSVYDDSSVVDLDPYMYRERHYQNGKIPAVCIRTKDAEMLLREMPKEAFISLKQEELQKTSHNVVAEIKGVMYPDEVIVFTAHYDSVSYSRGAYDNATGSATIMQMLAYYKNHRPKRTVKFVWCGSEEMGLLGSKAYTASHKEELKDYKLCINVDMTGVTIGSDIACCTSEKSLVSYIKYLGYEVGFGITPRQGVYSSDSTPFADNGVPAVSFARLAPNIGAVIHSRKDVKDYLSEDNYYKTCGFISLFSSRLINSIHFPVECSIPSNMKDELDIYLGRKDKTE
ncbi:MAG: M20/M25/M40 family metallo-hydrolase [Anaeroplasma sp.]